MFPELSQSLQDTLLGESIARLAGLLNNTTAGQAIRAIVSNPDALPQPNTRETLSQPRGSIWGLLAFAVLGFVLGVVVALVASKAL
jgi:hypothetical protein